MLLVRQLLSRGQMVFIPQLNVRSMSAFVDVRIRLLMLGFACCEHRFFYLTLGIQLDRNPSRQTS